MCRIETLIILYGMCIPMLSISSADGETGSDCIFDWEYFATQGNSDDILIDYSKQHITTLQDGGNTYNYISGPITTKAEVGDSYDAFCEIQKYTYGGQMEIVLNITKVCYFLENTYPQFLLPIGAKHNDFSPQDSICPMKVGIQNIYEVKSKEELLSPSKLENGKYYLFVSFLKNLKPIGGISGNFTVLRD